MLAIKRIPQIRENDVAKFHDRGMNRQLSDPTADVLDGGLSATGFETKRGSREKGISEKRALHRDGASAVVERRHRHLAGGGARERAVGATVDHQAAGAADPFPAVAVEGDRTLAGATSETLCFQASLPVGTSNTFQGAATTATFTFSAEQTSNNP